ncbi:hypothetical protein PRIPAC_89395 [Pristionchus pacificus]|uniref:Uncharacterized protein n=1 Tax=Pristionchus pacificus TaxID=54126 RepID=A0A2A6B6S0_PRIPA|nr:hypothetical protein PRIPAC_89395 [Pristionchus pacificus]|eukprot:PDM61561.1 hypothetical protein PRIPAC_51003 [Pristionchus pacificus]
MNLTRKTKAIFSSDYDGNDIRVVLQSHSLLHHPLSLCVFEDRLFYTDREHYGVTSINKFTGSDETVLMSTVSTPMAVRINHRAAQPMYSNKVIKVIAITSARTTIALRTQSVSPEVPIHLISLNGHFRASQRIRKAISSKEVSSESSHLSQRPFSCKPEDKESVQLKGVTTSFPSNGSSFITNGKEQLQKWMGQILEMELRDGRIVTGHLACTDREAKIVLSQSTERWPDGKRAISFDAAQHWISYILGSRKSYLLATLYPLAYSVADKCFPERCDQICEITDDSYKCSCHRGYQLVRRPGETIASRCCAIGEDPLILLSNRGTISQFNMATNTHVPLIQAAGFVVAMDFHLDNQVYLGKIQANSFVIQTLIWSDIAIRKIIMCKIGTVLIDGDVHIADALAVDWIHDRLFWTDEALDTISVMDLTTLKRRVLFADAAAKPRSIVGLIFWSDWGRPARIERAGMDGENRRVLITGKNVKWPRGLAIDLIEERLYWADAKAGLK